MKISYYLLAFMICLNAASMLVLGMGIAPAPITPYNTTELEGVLNATAVVESWDPSQQSFYDIGSGLMYFWNIFRMLITGFPDLLTALGAPALFVNIIRIPWNFVWIGFVISFLSGRDFMP